MADSILADQRRALKASKLVEALHEAGAASATIPHLDDDAWTLAAQAAGVRAPSDRTRALVRTWLAEREQPVDDPFAGLDDAA